MNRIDLLTRRPARSVIVLALAVVTGTAAILLWPNGKPAAPPLVAAANYSGRPTACLAADSDDTASRPLVQAIWTAMQRAPRGKAINVQQLVVPAGKPDQALPYLAGLVSQHCTLIIALTPPFTDALPEIAKASHTTQLTAVTTSDHPAPQGTHTVTGNPTEQATEVARQVNALA